MERSSERRMVERVTVDQITKESHFIGYEYKEITISKRFVSLCLDSYPCFGWKADVNNREQTIGGQRGRHSDTKVCLHFRRDRKISNQMELTRLQRNFDSCVSAIEKMERSKTTAASLWALAIGVIGIGFLAGSTFAVTADTPRMALCVILALPAFLGLLSPFFLYKAIVRKKTSHFTPLIEEKYEEIYAICEKGSHLQDPFAGAI